MKAYVLISIHSGEIVEAVTQLRKVKGVIAADMTFGQHDAVAVVEANDVNTIGKIVATQIQPIVGIEDTLTCLVIDL